MKKQEKNKTAFSCKKHLNRIYYLSVCSILIMLSGCDKQSYQTISPVIAPNLNVQEQLLLGKWTLKKSEIYEVANKDSTGQYVCTLINDSIYNSVCTIEFKSEYWCSFCPEYKAVGIIGGCYPQGAFSWRASQQNKLTAGLGAVYDILYLTNDSVAFSDMYRDRIMTLKNIVYYKRN